VKDNVEVPKEQHVNHLLIAQNFEKRLKAMCRAGKMGESAAARCERLLDLIRNKGLMAEAVYTKRTKNGEYRVSKCIKYDLGNGYRLVTIKDGQNLFVPFVGGHDETDLWLEHHRYDNYHADDPAYLSEEICTSDQPQEERVEVADSGEHQVPDPYEEQLLAKVDETTLRSVFQGLFHKQQA
jgi:hypothetical protein